MVQRPIPARRDPGGGPQGLGADPVLSFGCLPPLDPPVRFRAARSAGFHRVGLSGSWLRSWLAAGGDLPSLDAAAGDAGVAIAEFERLVPLGSRPDPAEGVAWDVVSRFGSRFVLVTGPYEGTLADAAERFAAVCDRAAALGDVTVGLEFLPFTNIPDIGTAAGIVEAAGRRNGGICLDVWHLYRSGANPAEIDPRVWPMVVRLQLCDGPLVAEHDDLLTDCVTSRRSCGAGEFDLTGLLTLARRYGAPAEISLEVFSRRLHQQPPEEVTRLLAGGLHDVVEASGWR